MTSRFLAAVIAERRSTSTKHALTAIHPLDDIATAWTRLPLLFCDEVFELGFYLRAYLAWMMRTFAAGTSQTLTLIAGHTGGVFADSDARNES